MKEKTDTREEKNMPHKGPLYTIVGGFLQKRGPYYVRKELDEIQLKKIGMVARGLVQKKGARPLES